ncbi:hypothetical protein [Mucilaginibacter dorajii]|uniref:Uncharacterized protein n=1 Tax=Mucilaginibacter dorajii TaxID=692994 RepID=A0ABP7QKZ6_9SPHI|nr:hypothetical protein [Mucilaginibacter dorajii]MCS3734086.1 sterol desaturase/sphingolipid hydroxylase (fatty acid hydroxylase superfamily) [Mucilaginibacter dorajii]
MEFNEDPIEEKEIRDEDYVDIYSKRAIFGFSVFSTMYAGILLIINLWVAGYKQVISQVLLVMFGFYFLSIYLVRTVGVKIDTVALQKTIAAKGQFTTQQLLQLSAITGLQIAVNIIAGLILTRYFFKKYFPDDDYYPRPIMRPVIIFIIIILFFGSILR